MDREIVQHIEYVPFGEVFIEERNNKWNTPFLFNAKELDEETGLYYYGARYYDPRTSVWISTDPLQEKYPNKTPYHYCSNNPVNMVDPDGRDDYYSSSNGKLLGSDKGPGDNMRLMDDENFKNINSTDKKQFDKMIELQKNSKIITIDKEKINQDMQKIADLSFGDNKVEQQLYILLDRKNAKISSEIGASGTNGETNLEYFPAPSIGSLLRNNPNTDQGEDARVLLIGQVHSHPKSTNSNVITLKTMSPDKDAVTARRVQLPIYGIDAMDPVNVGTSVYIHRVSPSGAITTNVGKTSTGFDIGSQALRLWGRSGTPQF
ncbi:RHS repeat-associated core domain-containing protein [Dysgonomonas sp. ZJ279]|uniref:RHS repeat-associated core domain-containing protein n=1 Tax=Dysgonomonas sp. ZJ279 TaxID=2709796 RepID=UPI002101FC07|nr:RHS repeat-associated core domain-containing protein [Dysgonomonas sp. ZJ279]